MTVVLQIAVATENWITCSGLESVVEEMKSAGQNDVALINAALEDIVKGLADKAEAGKFWTSVAPLLPWKKHHQLREQVDRKWEELKNSYGTKVHFIPKLSKLAFGTGNDEVHLVDKSRERFFSHVMESSISYFVSEKQADGISSVDDETGSDMDTQDQTIIHGQTSSAQPRVLKTSTPAPQKHRKRGRVEENVDDQGGKRLRSTYDLETEVFALKRRVERRWRSDAIIFAKHDEQLDTLKNEKTLDRIVFTGVLIQDMNGSLEERKPKMFEAVTNILKSFMENPPAPTYANHLNAQFNNPRRVLEIRFGNVETALQVRKAYANKIKECRATKIFPNELNGVNIGMTLTKSTKIRIAILKGLAKIVNDNTEKEVQAYCLEFQTQPMLKIAIEVGPNKTTSRTYGLTEAIEHVSEHFYIRDQDLIEAYTLAGNMKYLEQKFVVLRNA